MLTLKSSNKICARLHHDRNNEVSHAPTVVSTTGLLETAECGISIGALPTVNTCKHKFIDNSIGKWQQNERQNGLSGQFEG